MPPGRVRAALQDWNDNTQKQVPASEDIKSEDSLDFIHICTLSNITINVVVHHESTKFCVVVFSANHPLPPTQICGHRGHRMESRNRVGKKVNNAVSAVYSN